MQWGKERIRLFEESKDEEGEKTSNDKPSGIFMFVFIHVVGTVLICTMLILVFTIDFEDIFLYLNIKIRGMWML